MKRIALTFIALIALVPALKAQFNTNTYVLEVKEFSELKVNDGINVDYKCNPDSAGMAVFTTDPAKVSSIMFEPNGGKLTVRLSSTADKSNLPTVTVYSSYLTSVENSGDSTVRVLSVAPGPKLKARVIGNGRLVMRDVQATVVEGKLATGKGTVVISGQCNVAKLSLTGTGAIQADQLEAQEVQCKLMGTGSIGCWAVDKLNVSLSAGSGTIFFRGKPKIKNHSVGVKLEALDANE